MSAVTSLVDANSQFEVTSQIGETADPTALWDGDLGTLSEPSRRALVALIRGPYLSAQRHRELWNAIVGDELAIRSRLADLFLELEISQDYGVAFVKGAQTFSGEAPQVVRTKNLTFLDTVLLLYLRNELVRAGGTGRVIVSKDEVYDQLQVYRKSSSTDEAGFAKRISAAWTKLLDLSILVKTATEGRFEISPVLRPIFGADEIAAVQLEYERLLAKGSAVETKALETSAVETEIDDDEAAE